MAEVQRGLAREGRWWVPPLPVSAPALAKRLDTLPAAVLGELFAEVCARLQAQPLPSWPGLEDWAQGRTPFPLITLLDGSTLAALRKKTPALQRVAGLALAGRMMVRVEAFSQRPWWQLYTEDAAANDKRFAAEILAALPAGGLVVCALGVLSFLGFEDCSEQQKFFVTRRRHKTAQRTLAVLSHGPYSRDALVQLGQYRSHPCRYPLRRVSVLWQGQWYRSLTTVLDPQLLSARQVCELQRRRGRSEEACLLTKRGLELADLWTASPNGSQLQIYVTLIFSAVLLSLCQQVAQALHAPLERSSVARVLRAFSHFSRAVQQGESDTLVEFLCTHATLLGLIKRWRSRHRERRQQEHLVWNTA